MIIIKVDKKIYIISLIIAALMYPQTILSIINNAKNIYIAKQLSMIHMESEDKYNYTNNDKTKIVFMFDGGWKSIYTDAYKIIDKYNYQGNIAIISSLIGTEEHLSYNQLSKLYLQGWELLNHSYYHKNDMYDKCDEVLSDFNKAKKWMENRYIGKSSNKIVMPYGEINPYLINQLKNEGYHSVRTSDNILILDSDKIQYHPVTVVNLLAYISVDEVKDILIQSQSKDKTIIFILNRIQDTNNGIESIYSKEKLQQIITFINENEDKFQVITYSQIF